MAKKIIFEGRETTIRQLADEWDVSYMTAYMRYRAAQEGKPKRKTAKRPVMWNGKQYPSISALARELGYSREWTRQLIDKQERDAS